MVSNLSLTGSIKRNDCCTIHPDKLNDNFTEIGNSLLPTKNACFNAAVIEAFCPKISNSSQFFIPQMSSDDFVNHILKLKNKNSCGFDGISHKILNYQSLVLLNLLRTNTIYAWISLTFQFLLNTLKLFHFTKRVILMTSTISDQFCYFRPYQSHLNVIYTCTWNHTWRKTNFCILISLASGKIILVKLLYVESRMHGYHILIMAKQLVWFS